VSEKSFGSVERTNPETVLRDIVEVMHLARFLEYLDPDVPVILKDNISRHFLFLSANTTPWQLEGIIMALLDAGFSLFAKILRPVGALALFHFISSSRMNDMHMKIHPAVMNDLMPSEKMMRDMFTLTGLDIDLLEDDENGYLLISHVAR
jgi:hypothetical protein